MNINKIDFNCDCGCKDYDYQGKNLEINNEEKITLECGDCGKVYHISLKLTYID